MLIICDCCGKEFDKFPKDVKRSKHIGSFVNINEAEKAAIEARKKYMPFSQEFKIY